MIMQEKDVLSLVDARGVCGYQLYQLLGSRQWQPRSRLIFSKYTIIFLFNFTVCS